MEEKNQSCGNCGNFLQYYAFFGGVHFRPVNCGQCKAKAVRNSVIENRDSVCAKWIPNSELREKQERAVRSGLRNVLEKLEDILLILSLKEE